MLSYRHSFHAGNFADVHKHLVLSLLIDAFKRKTKPFCYIDTHSGRGHYDLTSKNAKKNGEFKEGILKLIPQRETPPIAVTTYLNIIQKMNPQSNVTQYPGSPEIASTLMREQDQLILTELHTSEYPVLKEYFKDDKRVAVHHQNGYQSLKAFIPPKQKRGLVLVDPSYELADEYERVAQQVIAAQRKWPTGCYVIWYPILLRSTIDAFEQRFIRSGIDKILVSEMCIHQDDVAKRLNGSGMLMVNPPWQIDELLLEVQPWLLTQLRQQHHGKQRLEWIVEESG